MTYTHLMFLGGCCSAVDESNAHAVILAECREEDAVQCYDIYESPPDMRRVRALFSNAIQPRRFAGFATRVAWSPDDSPGQPGWCVVTVERNGQARLAVRRERDERWTMIDFAFAPWFAASTAGAMRKWLDGDFSSPFRNAEDPRLLGQVRDMVVPPTQPDGRI